MLALKIGNVLNTCDRSFLTIEAKKCNNTPQSAQFELSQFNNSKPYNNFMPLLIYPLSNASPLLENFEAMFQKMAYLDPDRKGIVQGTD